MQAIKNIVENRFCINETKAIFQSVKIMIYLEASVECKPNLLYLEQLIQ